MKFKILSFILALTLILSACSLFSPATDFKLSDGEAAFHFIDVGQGDCTLVHTNDAVILIDAGTYDSSGDTVSYLKSLGIRRIDCLVLTHPHEDHMGGASNILSGFDIGTVFVNKNTSDSYFYERFIDEVMRQDITLEFPNFDCVYEYDGLSIKFLSPKKDYADENHNSIVTLVTFGETEALFMGDAETEVESDIITQYNLNADILKVGHHGSRYASSSEFLNCTLPGISIISCGKDNSYGHPHKEAVSRIERIGSTILRTDEEGTICFKTDGRKIYTPEGKEQNFKAAAAEIDYIGNKRSKVFHTDICTALPKEQNRIIFKTKDDAENAGYKPCRNCNP